MAAKGYRDATILKDTVIRDGEKMCWLILTSMKDLNIM